MSRTKRQKFVGAALVAASLLLGRSGWADTPAGVSEFLVPFDEDVFAYVTSRVTNATIGGTSTSRTTIDVTAWSSSVRLYYDHWEDGYELDPVTLTGADEVYDLTVGQTLSFLSLNVPRPRTGADGNTYVGAAGNCTAQPPGNAGQPDDAQLLLRRPGPLRHGRRGHDGHPGRLVRGDGHSRRRRGRGLPARAAAHQVHSSLWRGRDAHRLRAGRGGHPGDRRRHDDPDRLQRRRDLRLLQHRERLSDSESRPHQRDDPDASARSDVRPRPRQRRNRRNAEPGRRDPGDQNAPGRASTETTAAPTTPAWSRPIPADSGATSTTRRSTARRPSTRT